MKRAYLILSASFISFCLTAQAATYSGNGNSGFGGPIGLGSLTLTDDGTTVFGQVNKGPNNFNDVLVLYIDSVAGGFNDTSGFSDDGDGLRRAISGVNVGIANRSLMTFAGGFSPDYAIALGPSSDNYGGLWGLANGGMWSLPWLNTVNLTPTGNNASPTYTFSFSLAQIGSPTSFGLFGTYISNSGYRSDEALPGNATGAQGWNAFTQDAFAVYTIPEPSTLALLSLSGLAALIRFRRRS